MVFLITGASHTGKTALAQRLLEKYRYPYLSVDHLKMGLIRSGYTTLTPEDDEALTGYLWPVVREMVKTAVENRQNLIVDLCLVMSEGYIRSHFADIKGHACDIEDRGDDSWCTLEGVLADNAQYLALCRQYHCPYFLIDGEYPADFGL